MSGTDWRVTYGEALREQGVAPREMAPLARARRLAVAAPGWAEAAALAAAMDCRLSGGWADRRGDGHVLFALLEREGRYLLLQCEVTGTGPVPSQAQVYASADRLERHARDMFGLVFEGHPDPRRWTRHRAWPADFHPLSGAEPPAGPADGHVPPDDDYPFLAVQGSGVCEIPVGPVHAGIIEPGHFRFQAVGEAILRMEERLAYVHKGIERIAVGRDGAALARLAARVSGDSTVAHAWAACQALEEIAGVQPPPRAVALRALFTERERVANHLGDIGAICNDVGFAFAFHQFGRLREMWQQRSAGLFGHRLLMDRVVPGGVAVDLLAQHTALLEEDHVQLRRELDVLYDIILDHPSLEDRLFNTGRLTQATARRLGCLGYVGRASGLAFDVRSACPHPPYERLPMTVPVYQEGDVAARLRVRMDEIPVALDLMDALLASLPEGPLAVPLPAVQGEGLGIVEGWRGEILCYLRCDEGGRVARFFPRDPSWFSWPALEAIVMDNIVPDFPVCNKSVNASYSGHDL